MRIDTRTIAAVAPIAPLSGCREAREASIAARRTAARTRRGSAAPRRTGASCGYAALIGELSGPPAVLPCRVATRPTGYQGHPPPAVPARIRVSGDRCIHFIPTLVHGVRCGVVLMSRIVESCLLPVVKWATVKFSHGDMARPKKTATFRDLAIRTRSASEGRHSCVFFPRWRFGFVWHIRWRFGFVWHIFCDGPYVVLQRVLARARPKDSSARSLFSSAFLRENGRLG